MSRAYTLRQHTQHTAYRFQKQKRETRNHGISISINTIGSTTITLYYY